MKDGNGVMNFTNGERLESTWVQGVLHGIGTLTYPSGDKYVGSFVGGKKNGVGELHCSAPQRSNPGVRPLARRSGKAVAAEA